MVAAACSQESGKETVNSQMATAQKIANLEQKIDANQQEVNTLLKQYVQSGGQDLGAVMGQGLTPEQTQLLEAKLKSEEGIGYLDLVSDILSKQKNIEDLRVRIQDLEKTLPSPEDVQKGQRHFDLAMAYLTKEKGLDPAAAKALVMKVNLVDDLVPGFKVWNFYDEGVYGTFVTQGDAKVSPYYVTEKAKQNLIDQKNAAVAQRDELAKAKADLTQQVADLSSKRDQLNQEVSMLQAEREDLTKKVSDLQSQRDDFEARNNSVFYRIGWRKNLENEGMVRDPWYARPTLAKFSPADYPQHLDLRSSDTLVFSAQQAGVAKITKVGLAPGSLYKEGNDYAVTVAADGSRASLRFLNKDKFRAGRSIMILVN
jgi:FtsZ-binding cell division protein ZapB